MPNFEAITIWLRNDCNAFPNNSSLPFDLSGVPYISVVSKKYTPYLRHRSIVPLFYTYRQAHRRHDSYPCSPDRRPISSIHSVLMFCIPYHVSPTVTTRTPGILRFQSMFVFMQFVQFVFLFLCFFVKFTKFSHRVHNLFIIDWYTLITVKEEIRLPDNKAYKINFFIIAQAPKGVWALLILWGFSCHPITVLTIKRISLARFSACGGSLLRHIS